jgi:uncharacterized protein YjbI with pentapeptide repeats
MSMATPFIAKVMLNAPVSLFGDYTVVFGNGETTDAGMTLILYQDAFMPRTTFSCLVQLLAPAAGVTSPSDLPFCVCGPTGNSQVPIGVIANGTAVEAAGIFQCTIDTELTLSSSFTPPQSPRSALALWYFYYLGEYTAMGYGWLVSSGMPPTWWTEPVPPICNVISGGDRLQGEWGAVFWTDFTWLDLSGEDCGSYPPGSIFANSDLSGVLFSDGVLTGASFRGVFSLTGAIFISTQLDGVDFTGVDCTGVDFEGAVFSGPAGPANVTGAILGTDFTGAVCRGVDFSTAASVQNANFTGADLTLANFTGLDLTGVTFSEANLTGTIFSKADLTSAIFFDTPAQFSHDPNTPTDLSGATVPFALLGLDWTNLELAGVIIPDLPFPLVGLQASGADLTSFSAPGQTIESASFAGATLRGANFSGANLLLCDFTSAICNGSGDLPATSFDNANLMDANFGSAILSGTFFTYALLWGANASVAGATVIGTDFANAYLADLDFSGIADHQLTGSTFAGACLVNADFSGASLLSIDLSGAALQGAKFAGAQLAGAQLSGSAVALRGGTVQIALTNPPSTGFPTSIDYPPTTLPASATDPSTICPSRANGPCIGPKLESPASPMHTWRQGTTMNGRHRLTR